MDEEAPSAAAEKFAILKEQLYEAVRADSDGEQGKMYTQDDLTALNVVSDVKVLLQLVTSLSSEKLFQAVSLPYGQGLAWKWRVPEEAAK